MQLQGAGASCNCAIPQPRCVALWQAPAVASRMSGATLIALDNATETTKPRHNPFSPCSARGHCLQTRSAGGRPAPCAPAWQPLCCPRRRRGHRSRGLQAPPARQQAEALSRMRCHFGSCRQKAAAEATTDNLQTTARAGSSTEQPLKNQQLADDDRSLSDPALLLQSGTLQPVGL